jgi:hypothetical protein
VGPATTNAGATPATSQGAASIAIAATAVDPAGSGGPSPIAAAEWFEGADPGAGLGSAMAAADGSFGSTLEAVSGSVPTASRPYGEHLLWVRARDAAGNWGATTPFVLSVTPADGVFADGFESGTTARWTAVSGASRLAVGSAAAAAGRFGLAVTVAGKNAGYLVDASPTAEVAYRSRFSYAANGTTTPGSGMIDILVGRNAGGTNVFRIQYRRTSVGVPQLRAVVARRGGTTTSAWVATSNGFTAVETAWSSGRSTSFTMLVGGVAVATLAGLDTSSYRLDEIRLGPSAGLATGMSGTPCFDRFVSDRTTPLGP